MIEERLSGLIVPVPRWDGFVRRWRAEVDAVVPTGIPAYVTMLFPWVHPSRIDRELPRLIELLAGVEAFDFTLTGVEHFENANGTVACVGIDPGRPFRTLTRRLFAAWPEWPPYGGAFGAPPT